MDPADTDRPREGRLADDASPESTTSRERPRSSDVRVDVDSRRFRGSTDLDRPAVFLELLTGLVTMSMSLAVKALRDLDEDRTRELERFDRAVGD